MRKTYYDNFRREVGAFDLHKLVGLNLNDKTQTKQCHVKV